MIVVNIPSKFLKLATFLQTTNTGTIIPTKALLDCRATGLFVGTKFVNQKCLTTKKVSQPIPVYNVDGILNEVGSYESLGLLKTHSLLFQNLGSVWQPNLH
jgi:hypothetical protein